MKIDLNDGEITALKQVLGKLLEWVNYGAGVDAYLGEDTDTWDSLLLDPDDEANAHLCNVLARLGNFKIKQQQIAGATLRSHMIDAVVGLLEANGFENVKKIKN